jgi:hypothetical protein
VEKIKWVIALFLFISNAYSLSNLKLIATMMGEKTGDKFGTMVSTGDVNGDGYDDILIAGNNYSKLYFGGSPIDSIADIRFTGGGEIIDDVNGDGFDDLFIMGSDSAFFYTRNNNSIIMSGSSIGIGGDINNDGFNDYLLGNTNHINGAGIMVGRVRGYFGRTILEPFYDFSMEGENKWGGFSRSLTIAGDLNGDGKDEKGQSVCSGVYFLQLIIKEMNAVKFEKNISRKILLIK